MIDLYRNIRKFRIEHKMSQDTLAKLTGYTSRSSIAKIEKGEVDLPLSKIEAFADALNVEPSELMGDTWEDDVINSSRLDVAEHFDGDPFLIAKAMEAEKNDALSNQPELNKRDSKQIEDKSTSVESEFSPEIRMAARKLKNMKDSDRDITLKIIDYIAGKGKEANED